MRSTIAFTLLATAGFAAAQEQYSIDPNSVSQSTRDYWCDTAKAQCPLICLQQPGVKSQNTISNDCSPDDLSYKCVCDNNVAPNVTMYTQTMPFFVCQEWGTQCRKKCNGDNSCADKCTADHPCGAAEPFKGNASASASSSGSPSATKSGGSGGDPTSATKPFDGQGANNNSPQGNAGSALSTFGATFGTTVTLAGVFAAIVLM